MIRENWISSVCIDINLSLDYGNWQCQSKMMLEGNINTYTQQGARNTPDTQMIEDTVRFSY